MKPSDIVNWVKLALMILAHGKEIVETLGEIVEEIKSWFEDDPDEGRAVEEFREKATPLVTASIGRRASPKHVDKIGRILWNAPEGRVKKMTKGKTRRV